MSVVGYVVAFVWLIVFAIVACWVIGSHVVMRRWQRAHPRTKGVTDV